MICGRLRGDRAAVRAVRNRYGRSSRNAYNAAHVASAGDGFCVYAIRNRNGSVMCPAHDAAHFARIIAGNGSVVFTVRKRISARAIPFSENTRNLIGAVKRSSGRADAALVIAGVNASGAERRDTRRVSVRDHDVSVILDLISSYTIPAVSESPARIAYDAARIVRTVHLRVIRNRLIITIRIQRASSIAHDTAHFLIAGDRAAVFLRSASKR